MCILIVIKKIAFENCLIQDVKKQLHFYAYQIRINFNDYAEYLLIIIEEQRINFIYLITKFNYIQN